MQQQRRSRRLQFTPLESTNASYSFIDKFIPSNDDLVNKAFMRVHERKKNKITNIVAKSTTAMKSAPKSKAATSQNSTGSAYFAVNKRGLESKAKTSKA
jgi:hypothetical protein